MWSNFCVVQHSNRIRPCPPSCGLAPSVAWISPCKNSPRRLAESMDASRHAKRAMLHVTQRSTFQGRADLVVPPSTKAHPRPVRSARPPRQWQTLVCPESRRTRATPYTDHSAKSVRRRQLVAGSQRTRIGPERPAGGSICARTMVSQLPTMMRYCESSAASAPYAAKMSRKRTVEPGRSSTSLLTIATIPVVYADFFARNAIAGSGFSTMIRFYFGKLSATCSPIAGRRVVKEGSSH